MIIKIKKPIAYIVEADFMYDGECRHNIMYVTLSENEAEQFKKMLYNNKDTISAEVRAFNLSQLEYPTIDELQTELDDKKYQERRCEESRIEAEMYYKSNPSEEWMRYQFSGGV